MSRIPIENILSMWIKQESCFLNERSFFLSGTDMPREEIKVRRLLPSSGEWPLLSLTIRRPRPPTAVASQSVGSQSAFYDVKLPSFCPLKLLMAALVIPFLADAGVQGWH